MLVSTAAMIAIAVTAHLWSWLEPACANEYRRIVMKAAGGVGCFEFWLNRYQSLIGNIVTAAVAGATLIWVARQLVPANQQASISAAAALKNIVAEFQAHEAELLSVHQSVAGFPPSINGKEFSTWNDGRDIWGSLAMALPEYRAAAIRFKDVAARNQAPALLDASAAAVRQVRQLSGCVGTLVAVLNPDEGGEAFEDMPAATLNRAVELIAQSRSAMQSFGAELDSAISRVRFEIERAWVRIRQLEHAAVGPWWRTK